MTTHNDGSSVPSADTPEMETEVGNAECRQKWKKGGKGKFFPIYADFFDKQAVKWHLCLRRLLAVVGTLAP